MKLDYALNSSDPKAQSYFQGLESQAALPIKSKKIHVSAEHQITGVSFISVPTTDRSYGYGLKATALVVDSQLIKFTLDPMNPQNQTTVINKDGSLPDVNDPYRKYDEMAYYNVSRSDLGHMLKAGAYDSPDYFEHKLNEKLDGLTYQRQTSLTLSQLVILSRNGIRSTNLSESQADKKLTVTLVDSGLHIPRMDGRTTRNPIPNHLDYWLTQALEEIKTDYQSEDDGYRVDQALTDDYVDGQRKSEADLARVANSLGANVVVDSSAASMAMSSASAVHRSYVANKKHGVGAINTHSNSNQYIGNDREEVSNELQLSNSSNVVAKQQSALNSMYDSEGAAAISPKAETAGRTELDLDKPAVNGHIPLSERDSSNSGESQDRNASSANSANMAEIRRRHERAHAASNDDKEF